jgi:hypothetical protein
MSATCLYFVAKYIDDPIRCEPRNVGVVVWSPEGVRARFFAEKTPGGDVDKQRSRSVGASAYKQWIEYWRDCLAQERVRDFRRKLLVGRGEPEFLEAIASANKGNFLLAPGGECVADIAGPEDLEGLAEKLYRRLVQDEPPSPASETPAERLRQASERVLARAGLRGHLFFKDNYPISWPLPGGLEEKFPFSHACENGSLKALLQRVSFPKKDADAQQTADSTAWRFEQAGRQTRLPPEQIFALVAVSAEEAADKRVQTRLATLGLVGRVVNVREEEEAAAVLSQVPSLPGV